MKTTIKIPIRILFVAIMILGVTFNLYAQIPPNAVNADPSAKAISQVPLGQNILATGVLRFRFTNEATSSNGTGQIPPNSIRLTISFPAAYAYMSVNAIPKFVVEDADNGPAGVVHLINNALIDEAEVVDLQLNVRGLVNGASGIVTFNTDRITPVIVANTQTGNDNASASFLVVGTLPVKLEKFTTESEKCNARLLWTTSVEAGIDRFDIEVNSDGSGRYTKIGTVSATGSEKLETTYSFNYAMQNNNPHLFRLRMINKDGTSTYSYISRVNSGCSSGKDVILIYPSPARSSFTLNVTDKTVINTKALIYDVNGKRVSTFVITGNTVNVTVDGLPSGVYFVKLINGKHVKFVKE